MSKIPDGRFDPDARRQQKQSSREADCELLAAQRASSDDLKHRNCLFASFSTADVSVPIKPLPSVSQ